MLLIHCVIALFIQRGGGGCFIEGGSGGTVLPRAGREGPVWVQAPGHLHDRVPPTANLSARSAGAGRGGGRDETASCSSALGLPLPASPHRLFPPSAAYNTEPSLTLNRRFCITGLVCFCFFLPSLPPSAGSALLRLSLLSLAAEAEPHYQRFLHNLNSSNTTANKQCCKGGGGSVCCVLHGSAI